MQGRDLLLFLPGVDGQNLAVEEQFDFMSVSFDVWSMTVRGSDKSTFEQLTNQVREVSCDKPGGGQFSSVLYFGIIPPLP